MKTARNAGQNLARLPALQGLEAVVLGMNGCLESVSLTVAKIHSRCARLYKKTPLMLGSLPSMHSLYLTANFGDAKVDSMSYVTSQDWNYPSVTTVLLIAKKIHEMLFRVPGHEKNRHSSCCLAPAWALKASVAVLFSMLLLHFRFPCGKECWWSTLDINTILQDSQESSIKV